MLQLFSGSYAMISIGDRLVRWYEGSLIKELLDYFGEKYFSVQLGVYENFSVTPSLGGSLRNIILALAAAIIIAVCATAYMRVNIGGFVRALIANECLSPESAKSLSELGYFRSIGIRNSLSRNSALGAMVKRAEDATAENTSESEVATEAENASRVAIKKPKVDFLTAKFYLPEELRIRAENRFNPKGSGWLGAILISVVTVVVAAVLCVLVPELVQLADNIMTLLAP